MIKVHRENNNERWTYFNDFDLLRTGFEHPNTLSTAQSIVTINFVETTAKVIKHYHIDTEAHLGPIKK